MDHCKMDQRINGQTSEWTKQRHGPVMELTKERLDQLLIDPTDEWTDE